MPSSVQRRDHHDKCQGTSQLLPRNEGTNANLQVSGAEEGLTCGAHHVAAHVCRPLPAHTRLLLLDSAAQHGGCHGSLVIRAIIGRLD